MDREFDYEYAKHLCKSHKQLLNLIQKTLDVHSKDYVVMLSAAREVINNRQVTSQIVNALQSGNLDIQRHPKEKALLHATYVCCEGKKIVSELNGLHPRKEIVRDINELKKASSAFNT